MYMNKIFLFTLFLANLQEIFASDTVQVATKQNVTLELRKFKEHCEPEGTASTSLLKPYVCNPGTTKNFVNVVYDGKSLWNSESGEKTLTKLTLFVKNNLLQLLHFQFTKGGAEEVLYYKKKKSTFEALNLTEFNAGKKSFTKEGDYLDNWFLLDLDNKDLYLYHVTESDTLLDGVSKKKLNVSAGKPLLVRDGNQKVWEDEGHTKGVTSLEVCDFGNNKLLLLNLGGEYKYFVKNSSVQQSQWTSLSNENELNTKVAEFKAGYFTTLMEYDLAQNPDLNKLTLRRLSDRGNLNELTLMPLRNYRLNKVKFNQTDLWTPGDTQKRVFMMRLTLLGYEVRAAALYVTDSLNKLTPDEESHYYYKENGAFRKVTDKNEFRKLSKLVKSLSDKTRPFTYNNDWVHRAGKLDVTLYNDAEFTVDKQEDSTKGLVTTTLTPKNNFEFTSLSYGDLVLWPTKVRSTAGAVKTLEFVTKDSLVQLLHLTLKERTNYNLYLKKDGDVFTSVEPTAYAQYKELLKDPNRYVDNKVHVDVNEENLNQKFFKVVKTSVDGVHKKVVTVENLKVNNVKALGHVLWTQRYDPHEFAKMYEFFSVGDSNLLVLHLETQGRRKTKKFFKKQDNNTQWVEMSTESMFNNTLSSFKLANRPEKVDLDLSTRPLETHYTVDVTPLLGSRTKLVLTPVKGKVVGNLKFKETNLWTSNDTNRGVKAHLYLDDYYVKFVKLDVLTNQNSQELQSEVKKKWVSDTDWNDTEFDTQLSQFETTNNNKPFRYSSTWQLPSKKFDTKSFLSENFTVSEVTDGLVKTTTYVPQTWMQVNEVLVDESKVWPLASESVEQDKKLKLLEVLSKDHMVQLVHVQNVSLNTPETPEDLYYKKEGLVYKKLENLDKFNELKKTLSQKDQYVDDKVKLDLSAEVPSTMFSSDTVLEDGLEKTVVQVKVGKLYQVQASPPMWTSQDGEYVTKLEKYSKDDRQFLVLHLAKDDKSIGKKYFEKPMVTQPQAAPQEQQQQESQQQVLQESQESYSRPSFVEVTTNTEFYKKLKEVKASVSHTEVALDLNSYHDQKFVLKRSTEQTARLYQVYPKAEYRVNSLVFGSKQLWTKSKDDERLVEAKLYVHDGKTKLVKAVVWEGDQTDETPSSLKFFQLNEQGDGYDSKEEDEFEKALTEVLKTKPTPLSTAPAVVLPTEPLCFNKLLLSDTFDPQLFSTQSQQKGVYTVTTVERLGDDTFVNLVENDKTVLWKAQQTDQLWKSATMAVSTDVGLLDLVFTENTKDVHSFFLLDKNEWKKVDSAAYQKEFAKVPGQQQVQQPQQPARQDSTQGASASAPAPSPASTSTTPGQSQDHVAQS